MKTSKYNFIFPYDKDSTKKLFYNSLTNALALVENEKFDMYQKFCDNNEAIEDSELLENLIKGGYIIDKNIDELDTIRLRLYKSRFGSKGFSLTIAPTLKCNFGCVYCYEEGVEKTGAMSKETQEKIINMVDKHLDYVSDFNVNWYGGEPLLEVDIIKGLSKRFIEMCKKRGVNYRAGIVTNGYLLTPEVVSELSDLSIHSIQVTLDGTKEQHDQRRPLINGGPTYDTIISNIRKSKDNLPCVISLRINIDKENVDKIDPIINILRENNLEKHVLPYIAMVENYSNNYNSKNCFQNEAFSQIELNYKTKYDNNANRYLLNMYPRDKRNYCGADSNNSYLINSDGKLYKCWVDIGSEELSVGDLNKVNERSEVYQKYMLYDPTYDSDCYDCNYLPICMGGCPNRRLKNSMNRCTNLKYQMKEYINTIATQLVNELENAE